MTKKTREIFCKCERAQGTRAGEDREEKKKEKDLRHVTYWDQIPTVNVNINYHKHELKVTAAIMKWGRRLQRKEGGRDLIKN